MKTSQQPKKLALAYSDGSMTTHTQLPEPLTPPDCDLSNFPYFPFDAVKFRDSDFAATVDPASGFYAVMLWAIAWHQVPAASLPDNDIILARLAGFGRSVDDWKKVREGALYGFVKCSDGRLYHKHLAEHANKSWGKSRKAKEAIAARWAKNSGTEKANDNRTTTDLPESYERNTNDDTNVIQREERRGEEYINPANAEKTKQAAAEASDVCVSEFNRLVDSYPFELGSLKPARIQFFRLCKGKQADRIHESTTMLIEAAREQRQAIGSADSPLLRCHLVTWLTDERWKDPQTPVWGNKGKGGAA